MTTEKHDWSQVRRDGFTGHAEALHSLLGLSGSEVKRRLGQPDDIQDFGDGTADFYYDTPKRADEAYEFTFVVGFKNGVCHELGFDD